MKSIMKFFLLGFLAVLTPTLAEMNARTGAAAVANSPLIYVIGGQARQPMCNLCTDDSTSATTEVSIYDVEIDDFWAFEAASLKHARAFHTAVAYEDSIYVFGGHESNNDIEVFNPSSNTWSIVEVADDGKSWTPLGDRPSARHSHVAAVLQDKMFVFGGLDAETGNALNDLWTYDFVSKEWAEVKNQGAVVPSPRVGSTVVSVSDSAFIIFGGVDSAEVPTYYNHFWRFNVQFSTWSHITRVEAPVARAYATGFDGGFFGGVTANAELLGDKVYLNDMWYVASSGDLEEFVFPSFADVPTARAGAAGIYVDEYYYIFFGHGEETQPNADTWSLHIQISKWYQGSCLPGYFFPSCELDCAEADWCNGHGTCLGNNTCCCDAGWIGDNCERNACDDYRGFSTEEMNAILLPKSLESTYAKLEKVVKNLQNVREILPSIETTTVDTSIIAEESYNFFKSCLVEDLCPVTECFEDLIGCDAACGIETSCIIGDECVNGQCIGGAPRNCSGDFENNACVHSWCDETNGCMHSVVDCEDDSVCTINTCDPAIGCVTEKVSCDDGDCCTTDYCDEQTGECVHESKCADWNPCTIDECLTDCTHQSECHYKFVEGCYLSKGQNANEELCPGEEAPRSLGYALQLTGDQMVPSQDNDNTASGYAWLRTSTCELVYKFTFDSDLADNEDGAHFYGNADKNNNAGVVHTLPEGPHKVGAWNYCADGFQDEDILSGEFYVTFYFSTGDIRTQLEFVEELHHGTSGCGGLEEPTPFPLK